MARDDPMFGPYGPHASPQARVVFTYLHRRGGSVRLTALLAGLALDRRVIAAAIDELCDRYWITLVWRKARPRTPEDEPRALTDIERLVGTWFGRRKYRTTWPRVD